MIAIINAELVMRDHLIPEAVLFMEDGKITELKLYPIDLGMELPRSQKGVPVLNGSEETLRYLQDMCKPYGTEMDIENGVGTVRL